MGQPGQPPASGAPLRVLLVEDNEDDYVLVRAWLERAAPRRFALTWARSWTAGLEALAGGSHDVCLLDYFLGQRTGLEFLQAAREQGLRTPVVLLTGRGTGDIDQAAMHAGAADYLSKERLEPALLERALRYAVERFRAQEELRRSHDDLLAILNRLQVGSILTDDQGRVTFVSEVGRGLIGPDAAEPVGRHWREIWPLEPAILAELATRIARPDGDRSRVTARIDRGRAGCWVDIEAHPDPRDPRRAMLFLYDVSEVHDLRRQLDGKARFGDLVGRSSAMRQVFDLVHDLAAVDTTVLVEGETGTGKELVARALHAASRRAGRPFLAVNCAGLTDSLLASQLFGHRRGAFTGAVEDHQGVFEAAEGGTVLLDEIGDVSAAVQMHLLRVLESREILRLGDPRPRTVDVRLVAATNRDLAEEVERGRMRADLYYRLRVASIRLPPLRQRREDIPLLVEEFLARARARTGKVVRGLSEDALRLLLEQPWRGNVRELLSVIEFAVIRARGPLLQVEDLPPEVRSGGAGTGGSPEQERQRLLDALGATGGNRTAAARRLGMSRATLYRRLAELAPGGRDPQG